MPCEIATWSHYHKHSELAMSQARALQQRHERTVQRLRRGGAETPASAAPEASSTTPLRLTVSQRCAELGVRLTDKRRQVVELFDQLGSPIDLDEVWWKACELGVKVNRSSLHRLAGDLVELGVLNVIGLGDRRARFATPLLPVIELATPDGQSRRIDDPTLSEMLIDAAAAAGMEIGRRKIIITVQ
jgi:Fe2+ or Zn2+ uptake regulation protein